MKNFLFLLLLATACTQPESAQQEEASEPTTKFTEPVAEGFNAEGSDQSAMKWARAVMQAQGGRAAWDSARFFHWNFFGKRSLLWDKQTGRVRITVPADSTVYLINIKTDTGRVYTPEQVYSSSVPGSTTQEVQEMIQEGESIWNNDSYWLFMPFKLMDPGVTLYYAGMITDPADSAKRAAVIEMHFEEVGDTPQNKYRVYIDPRDSLVHAWAYYNQRSDERPTLITPWQDYQQYGALKLSSDRGDGRTISDIWVKQAVPETYFTTFWPADYLAN